MITFMETVSEYEEHQNGGGGGQTYGVPNNGLLAEFKLSPLEFRILNELTVNPSFWMQYVDDINVFIIWDLDEIL